MSCAFTLYLILVPSLGFGGGATLQLSDPGLPLQEIRPLDRRSYVLILDANWNKPAAGVTHYVNIRYPDGSSSSHRVLNDLLFRRGEVRCLLPGHELAQRGGGGKLTLTVSSGEPAADGGETISTTLAFTWPPQREVLPARQSGRFADPLPVDVFQVPAPATQSQQLPPPKKAPAPPK